MEQKLTNNELGQKSKWLRKELFELFLQAKQGHPGNKRNPLLNNPHHIFHLHLHTEQMQGSH